MCVEKKDKWMKKMKLFGQFMFNAAQLNLTVLTLDFRNYEYYIV